MQVAEMNPAEADDADLRRVVLHRLDEAYGEAMAAWSASRQPATRTPTTHGPQGSVEETQVVTTTATGDARYLKQALDCLAAIRQLAGLDAPLRAAHAHLVSIQARMPRSEVIAVEGQTRLAIESQEAMAPPDRETH